MSIVNTLSLESNRKIKINFDGGDLSSDAGLLFIKDLEDFPEIKLLLRGDSGFATLSFINSVKKTVPVI